MASFFWPTSECCFDNRFLAKMVVDQMPRMVCACYRMVNYQDHPMGVQWTTLPYLRDFH